MKYKTLWTTSNKQ